MTRLVLSLLAVAWLALPGGVAAHGPDTGGATPASFQPPLGAMMPAGAWFSDAAGRPIDLSAPPGVPTILTFNYYRCQDICPLQLQELARTLRTLPLRLGADYRVVTVSIDPRDTPETAAVAKAPIVDHWPAADEGWRFLSGSTDAIDRLTGSLRFTYHYDAGSDSFAHPVGLLVVAPDGRLTSYLAGFQVPAEQVRLAVVDAAGGRVGTLADQVLLLCYHYTETAGRYTPVAENVMRAGAIGVFGLLAGLVTVLSWRGRARAAGEA